MTHDELAHDLAESRREIGEIVAERLQTGPSFRSSAGQMDVFSIRPSWTKPFPTCWEVKVNRSDFLADVRTAKYESYLPSCRRLYFACPSGLVKRDEVPKGMGLTVRNENGWHVVKAPKTRPLDKDVYAITVMAMLLRLNAPGFNSRADEDRLDRVRRYLEAREIGRVVSRQVQDDLAAARAAVRDFDDARRRLAILLDRDDEETLPSVTAMVTDLLRSERVEVPTVPDELRKRIKEVEELSRKASAATWALRKALKDVDKRRRV